MINSDINNRLPEGWQLIKLEKLIKDAQSGFACGERAENGVIQLRMNNVDTSGNMLWDNFIRVPASDEKISRYCLKPNDVLFNNTNSTELVGKTALFSGHTEDVVYSNHFTRLRVDTDMLDSGYLALWLNYLWNSKIFEGLCNKWIGQSAVKNDKLLNLEIPLPPLSEQKRLVTTINLQKSIIQRAQSATEAQLQAALALPTAYLRAIFEDLKANDWPKMQLGEAGEIVSGVTLGRELRGSSPRRVPYLRVANVKDGYLDLADINSIEATEEEIRKLKLIYGDILLTEGGDPDKLGRGTFWREQFPECIHQNHIFRVRFDLNQFSPEFISYQIGSSYGKRYFLDHAKQTTGIATINQKVLKGFPLMAPPLKEQQRIVGILNERLENSGKIIKGLKDQVKYISQLRIKILLKAFNGEL